MIIFKRLYVVHMVSIKLLVDLSMSWFENIFGFEETSYYDTQAKFCQHGAELFTMDTPSRSFHSGSLILPSLAELRKEVLTLPVKPVGKIKLSGVQIDAYELHRRPEVCGALIQVASQFNLLEMPTQYTTPEKGITGYQNDNTQGPACAMACAAATVYRNYLVRTGGQIGQTSDIQLNTLADMDKLIGIPGIRMQNGYAMMSQKTLLAISRHIESLDESLLDKLRQSLRVGMHVNTEVTIPGVSKEHRVTQVLCSALPVAYHRYPVNDWKPFALLILQACYEATLLAGLINYHYTGNPRIYLTLVGGGAFGNSPEWITSALRRALCLFRNYPLDVYLVSNRKLPVEIY